MTRNVHVKYQSSASNGSKVMAKVEVFRNVSQIFLSRPQGHHPAHCHLTRFHYISINFCRTDLSV